MLMNVNIFSTVSLFVKLLSTVQQFKVLNIRYEGAKSRTASLQVCVSSTHHIIKICAVQYVTLLSRRNNMT